MMKQAMSVGVVMFLTMAASAPSALASDAPTRFVVEQGRVLQLEQDGPKQLDTPCVVTSVAEHGGALFAACEEAGIAEFDLSDRRAPRFVQVIPTPSAVTTLSIIDERVWVWTNGATNRALPLDELRPEPEPAREQPAAPPELSEATEAPEAQPYPTEEPAEAQEPPRVQIPEGTVIDSDVSGYVIIDLGTDHGLEPGMHIELFSEENVDLGAGNVESMMERLSVSPIEVLGTTRSKLRLGLGERVPTGSRARVTTDFVTATSTAPQRVSGQTEVHVGVRPYLALGELGGGALMEAGVVYRAQVPLAFELRLSPIAFAGAEETGAMSGAVDGLISYDSDLFQLGLGTGYARGSVQDRPNTLRVSQYARIGARDGLYVSAFNSFELLDDGFNIGSMRFGAQVPMTSILPTSSYFDYTWLVGNVEGGYTTGHFLAEVGVRLLVKGNGNGDSVFLTPTIGVGHLNAGSADLGADAPNRYLTGPMFGLQMEWRPSDEG